MFCRFQHQFDFEQIAIYCNIYPAARQLHQGTPVLKVPESPSAPDFADSIKQESKA